MHDSRIFKLSLAATVTLILLACIAWFGSLCLVLYLSISTATLLIGIHHYSSYWLLSPLSRTLLLYSLLQFLIFQDSNSHYILIPNNTSPLGGTDSCCTKSCWCGLPGHCDPARVTPSLPPSLQAVDRCSSECSQTYLFGCLWGSL